MTGFRALISWVVRYLALFVILLLALLLIPAATKFVQEAISNYEQVSLTLTNVEKAQRQTEVRISTEKRETEERIQSLRDATSEALAGRIDEIERESRVLSRTDVKPPVAFGSRGIEVNVAAIKSRSQVEAKRYLLDHEREILSSLLWVLDAPKELERLRRVHEDAYSRLKQNEEGQSGVKSDHGIQSIFMPWSEPYRRLKALERDHKRLASDNQAAWDAYSAHKQQMDSRPKARPSISIPDFPPSVLEPFEDALGTLRASERENWLGRQLSAVANDARSAALMALQVLAAAIAVPILIKAFFYFLLAPIASRRPPIALLPHVKGFIGRRPGPASNSAGRDDTVSRTVGIDAFSELLVHPEYLQSTPHEARCDTKWFLSNRFWLASLAAGLSAVTRIRSDGESLVVLSATHDPLSEIEAIELPPESAIVLQPRHVVGVLQQRDRPAKITSHWRLGSLHAWLTWQLRYLVFHGPATLIVSGCRGVRVEAAEIGRGINQAATIGFSANLKYFSRRSETFFGYLSGKQPLLHDSFAGADGSYIYQEIPVAPGRAGVTARGLEGFTDGLLKVFGI